MGTQLPRDFTYGRPDPAALFIAVVWVAGLLLLKRAGTALPWHEGSDAPDTQPEPRRHSKSKDRDHRSPACGLGDVSPWDLARYGDHPRAITNVNNPPKRLHSLPGAFTPMHP